MSGLLDRILLLCRPGFEGDCAAELASRTGALGVGGYARARPGTGYAEYFVPGEDPLRLMRRLGFRDRVFPRQWCATSEPLGGLPPDDRVGPLVDAIGGVRVQGALVEQPDGEATRSLARLASRLAGPLRGLLDRRGQRLPDASLPWLHVVLLAGDAAFVGLSPPGEQAPAPGGVVRLASRAGMPSRSALKLEEAMLRLLDEAERVRELHESATAVDLGASPGGWSWVLRRHGLAVTAVDNGPLAASLDADPHVRHVRADAFTYEPPAPVDWLVCDVADKPARIAERVARWLRRGWCRRAIFNLKLPMRRRWDAVCRCRERFLATLGERAPGFELRVAQLYHDREEVTACARPAQPPAEVRS